MIVPNLSFSTYEKRILFFASFILISLFLYSFTQIDLGLTLNRASFLQDIQKRFQYIGYFNRTLSVFLYSIILCVFFIFYRYILKEIVKKKITKRFFYVLVGFITLILVFSYNAFSYDLFNYIFDARILTKYGENPYVHKALDFPSDPMLGFMRWTHRNYPYGPIWLGVTVPLSYVGMGFLLPTMILFKSLVAFSYIGATIYIGKIAKKFLPDQEVLSMALFALNPLILFESLVSGHHDIVMLFLVLVSIYYLFEKRLVVAYVFLFLSVGIKFATIFLLPVFLYKTFINKTFSLQKFVITSIICMILAVIAVSLRTQFQPWYLVFVLPFCALLPYKRSIKAPVMFASFIALCEYMPYLWIGNWDAPVPTILHTLTFFAMGGALLLFLIFFYREQSKVR